METRRRWIASIVEGAIGAALWIVTVALITIIILLQGVQKSSNELLLRDIPKLIVSGGGLFYLSCCCGVLPMFIITTLGAYHQHKITGDSLIDRFWKNPKIKDG